jgi:hypothetical protein
LGYIDGVCKDAKKVPGVGSYEPQLKTIKPRILGNYNYKVAKSAFTEEAQFKGLQSAPFHNVNNQEKFKFRKTL